MVTVDHRSIGDVLFGATRRRVLGLLVTRPDETFHLRQIARLTGAGLGALQRELTTLTGAGLLLRESRGRQVFYRLNAACPVLPELRGLVLKTAGLADVLRDALRPLAGRVVAAFVYGSFARGDPNARSDVDVMVIGDVAFADVTDALFPAQARLAREINPTVYPPTEFRAKLAAGHPFLKRVMAEPRIMLTGDEHELGRLAQEPLAPRARADAAGDRRPAGRRRPRPARQHQRHAQ